MQAMLGREAGNHAAINPNGDPGDVIDAYGINLDGKIGALDHHFHAAQGPTRKQLSCF